MLCLAQTAHITGGSKWLKQGWKTWKDKIQEVGKGPWHKDCRLQIYFLLLCLTPRERWRTRVWVALWDQEQDTRCCLWIKACPAAPGQHSQLWLHTVLGEQKSGAFLLSAQFFAYTPVPNNSFPTCPCHPILFYFIAPFPLFVLVWNMFCCLIW